MTAALETAFGALFGFNTANTATRWGTGGAEIRITFAFAEQAPGYSDFSATPFKTLPEALRAVARSVFAEIADLTNIVFVERTGADLSTVDIVISGTAGGGARAALPGASPSAGDMYIDIAVPSDGVGYTSGLTLDPLGDGSYINFQRVFSHELGHALGLAHPRNYPVVNGVYAPNTDGYPTKIDPAVDTRLYSIMSYFQPPSVPDGDTYDGPNTKPSTFMYLDILALQSLYGVDATSTSGADVYTFRKDNAGYVTIWDSGGRDAFDLSNQGAASIVDLNDAGLSSIGILAPENLTPKPYQQNVVIGPNTIIEEVVGTRFADTITGNAAANRFTGGGGDDTLDGGAGVDAAIYAGASRDFSLTLKLDGRWEVRDLRTGAAEGVDTLKNIEVLKFSDKTVALTTTATGAWGTAVTALLRLSTTDWAKSDDVGRIVFALSGGATEAQTIADIIQTAGATTSVATLAYQFFTGKIPGQPGVDYLVAPSGPNANNLNSAYYASFNLENRYINFAVNLGKLGEGKETFQADYGGLSLFEATRKAYAAIFGGSPGDAKVHLLIDSRVDYFAYYGGDGPNGAGTKAAMVGWLLAEAQKADLGVLARSNDAWLADLADGAAPFAINILDPAKGYYKADFIFG
jgi:hypothetical protein